MRTSFFSSFSSRSRVKTYHFLNFHFFLPQLFLSNSSNNNNSNIAVKEKMLKAYLICFKFNLKKFPKFTLLEPLSKWVKQHTLLRCRISNSRLYCDKVNYLEIVLLTASWLSPDFVAVKIWWDNNLEQALLICFGYISICSTFVQYL